MSEGSIGAAALIGRFTVATVLLLAAIPKLTDRAMFERTLVAYSLIPRRLQRHAAGWIPSVELAIGIALFVGLFVAQMAVMAALLIATFALAVAINVKRGRDIDCGCSFGSLSQRKVGWRLVFGDLLLVSTSIFVAVESPDVLTLAGGSEVPSGLERNDALAAAVVATTAVISWNVTATSARLRRARQDLTAGVALR